MNRESPEPVRGRQAGLAICDGCLAICEIGDQLSARCSRCSGIVHMRIPDSLQKTSAYLVAAAILYAPANLLPVMHTRTVLGEEDDTIFERRGGAASHRFLAAGAARVLRQHRRCRF